MIDCTRKMYCNWIFFLCVIAASKSRAFNTSDTKVVDQVNTTSESFFHHYHIAKTGGTTFLAVGASFLGVKDCKLKGYGVPLQKWLQSFSSAYQNGCRFSSFEEPYPTIKPHLPAGHFKIVILRHPVAWLASSISHDDSEGFEQRHKIGNLTILDLNEMLRRKRGYYGIYNFQTHWLSKRDSWRGLSDAVQAIDEADVVGVTEHYDAFLCLVAFKFKLQEHLHNCSCRRTAPVINQGTHMKKTANDTKLITSLQDLKKVGDMLRFDTLLYAHAFQRFLSEVNYVQQVTRRKFLCDL